MATNAVPGNHNEGEGIRRPNWPYQSWSDPVISQDFLDEKSSDHQMKQNREEEELLLEEPDHWLADLDDDVSDTCPIKCVFDLIESPNVSCTLEAEEIRSDIVSMMEKTLKSLSTCYKIFKGSYLLPVGSMAENSKINKVDEFDFAVILPALAERNIFSLLLRKDSILKDREFSDFVRDLQYEGDNEVKLNFAKCLKQIWSKEMIKHVGSNLKIQNTSCYSDDVSVAGTFHLKRKDNSIIDLDVCFWVPLDFTVLSSAPDEVGQKRFLQEHCLDEHGFVYAILPRDESIDFSLDNIRFATSCLERRQILQYGPDNPRLRCYRLCKSVVSRLVPKFKKRKECIYCYESLFSSFCLKNIVLYMTNIYKSENFWTEKQLPNRVVEVFAILSLCMKVNFHRVSAFFVPYEIQINRTLCYSVKLKSVMKHSCPEDAKPCILPNISSIISKVDDEISKEALADYDDFLQTSEWGFAEVICRLAELLSVLRTEDINERAELRQNSGWNTYGLC